MESTLYVVLGIIIYTSYVSIGAKIIYSLFFKDRITQGEITEKQSPELAGKRYLSYSQILFSNKGYICEDSDVEEYFRSKNKKILSVEEFEKLTQNKVRKTISIILWVLSILINIIEMILLAIWNLIKRLIPSVARMAGMDKGLINMQRKKAYDNLIYHGYDHLSESDKTWLNMG